jgi:hypothetical protein
MLMMLAQLGPLHFTIFSLAWLFKALWVCFQGSAFFEFHPRSQFTRFRLLHAYSKGSVPDLAAPYRNR